MLNPGCGIARPLLLVSYLITGRNEVVAKGMFLLLSVILLTGRRRPQCMLGRKPPPGKEAWHAEKEAPPPGIRCAGLNPL